MLTCMCKSRKGSRRSEFHLQEERAVGDVCKNDALGGCRLCMCVCEHARCKYTAVYVGAVAVWNKIKVKRGANTTNKLRM